MTQEEKQLLLKDLCARFPYGVICQLSNNNADVSITEKLELGGLEHFISGTMDVKPYLRPMSSMTEEEKEEYHKQVDIDLDRTAEALRERFDTGTYHPENRFTPQYCHIDWLNAHHFDYRGLIEKGLALEAKEGMYK